LIRFGGSHEPEIVQVTQAPEVRTRAKEEVLRFAGFEPASIRDEFFTQKISEIRRLVISLVGEKAGFSTAEVEVLVDGRKTLDEAGFKAAFRRIQSGVRILPEALRKSISESKVVTCGHPGRIWKVLGALPRVTRNDEMLEKITAGASILFQNESHLAVVERQWKATDMDVAVLKRAAYTPARAILETALEANFTAEMLSKLLPKAVLDGDKVIATYGYAQVVFDFAEGMIDDARVLKHVTARGRVLSRNTVLGLFALSLTRVTTQASVDAKLKASATSIFEEKNTGYGFRAEDSRHEAVIRNKVGILSVQAKSLVTFNLTDKRDYSDVIAAANVFADAGMAICIDDKADALFVGDGARARLIGRRGNTVLMSTDASSEAKRYARPKRAARLIAETVSTTGKSTIEASGLAVKLESGLATDYGTRFEVFITNSVMGPGSGVAIGRPGMARRIRLLKTISNDIPAVYLPAVGTGEAGSLVNKAELLKKAVVDRLEINRGVLHHGDVVFAYNGNPYGVFNGQGMTAFVVGDPVIRVKPKSESVSVAVKVAIEFEFADNKLSVDGVKATTIEYPVTLVDENGNVVEQPEIILTKEEIKGAHVVLLRAWADDVKVDMTKAFRLGWVTRNDLMAGAVVYDTDTGLNADQMAAFVAWREANSTVMYMTIVVDDETVHILKAIVDEAKVDAEFAKDNGVDPDAFVFGDNGVVTQKIQVIRASMILGIEISTVLENVGTSAMIGEQLIALKHIDEELGNILWHNARKQRKAVEGMLAMALTKRANDTVVLGPVLEFNKELRGRKLIEYFAKKYPEGLTIVDQADRALVTLRFDALMELGALLPGGSATGIALSVLELLIHLHVDRAGARSWDHYAKRLTALVASSSMSWAAESRRALGSVTRTQKKDLLARKVKTTFSRTLEHEQIGINPYDPLVHTLIPAEELPGNLDELDGKVLPVYGLASRAPMISVFGGYIKITSEAPIGMFLVKAYSWAYGNEGDGDGDPITVLVLRNPNIIDRIRVILTSSPFGPSAYRTAHGDDILKHPYTAFFMENAKKVVHGVTPKVTEIGLNDYIEGADRAGEHYKVFMGKTFAICSYLTFKLGVELENTGYTDPALETAVVLAWRRLYEGLALSGVSNTGNMMYKWVMQIGTRGRIAISSTTRDLLLDNGYNNVVTMNGGQDSYVYGVDAVRYAWSVIDPNLDVDVAAYLYKAIVVTSCYSTIEREARSDEYESVSPYDVISVEGREHFCAPGIFEDAIVFGTLRRGSKGDGVAIQLGAERGNGLFRHLTPGMLHDTGAGIVNAMLTSVKSTQEEIAQVRKIIEDREAQA